MLYFCNVWMRFIWILFVNEVLVLKHLVLWNGLSLLTLCCSKWMNYKQLDIGFNSTPYMLYTRDYSSFETAYIFILSTYTCIFFLHKVEEYRVKNIHKYSIWKFYRLYFIAAYTFYKYTVEWSYMEKKSLEYRPFKRLSGILFKGKGNLQNYT